MPGAFDVLCDEYEIARAEGDYHEMQRIKVEMEKLLEPWEPIKKMRAWWQSRKTSSSSTSEAYR